MSRASAAVAALAFVACRSTPEEPTSSRAAATAAPARSATAGAPASVPVSARLCQQRAALKVQSRQANPAALVEAREDLLCACDGGIGESCTGLGQSYLEDRTPDPTRANPAFRRACELGDAWGCTNLGVALAKGKGAPADPAAAHALYVRGCELGDGLACTNAATQLANGRLGTADPARARELFRRGCALGDQVACNAGR